MKRTVTLLTSCLLLTCMFAGTALAADKFWVSNRSDYLIYHVYASQDTSGGNRDLLGPNGIIPEWDQAKTLKPNIRGCYSDVAVVNQYDQWVWFWDVDVCNPATTLAVYNEDFFD